MEANLVKNRLSSIAASPPPTTATVLSLKKNPSQVAQAETPFPFNLFSLSRPIHLADAPVARTMAPASIFSPEPNPSEEPSAKERCREGGFELEFGSGEKIEAGTI